MNQLNKLDIVLIIFFIFLILCLSGCFNSNQLVCDTNSLDVTVTEVIDGDTIRVSLPNGSISTIRLLGIDCPETSIQDNNWYEYQNVTNTSCLTFYGAIAKSYVESLINDSKVTIVYDDWAEKKDQYDRNLCYVFYGGNELNEHLLRKGYARVFTVENFSKKSAYLSIQEKSISQLNGLWNCSSAKITISYVHYNAKGNDEQNLNDEYVVIINNQKKAIDLTGWSIEDIHGNHFDFPSGFSLASTHSVTVYTGNGINKTTALYWNHQTPVWNNDGDTVFLQDEEKTIIETYSW